MLWLRTAIWIGLSVATAAVVVLGFVTQERWRPWLDEWLEPAPTATAASAPTPAVAENQTVRLTPQAQTSLGLIVAPLKPETFWRTITLPAEIVDYPAESDHGVVAPTSGVVARVHASPGDLVRPGEVLFTLRILSEALLASQSELFKTTQEMQIVKEQQGRLVTAAATGAVSESRLMELDYQLRRLNVAAKAARQELQTRGFSQAQIDAISEGNFVTELQLPAPAAKDAHDWYEFQELKVELGQQVTAGQTLALVAHHEKLQIVARGFRHDLPWVLRSYREGWPVEVDFLEDSSVDWPNRPELSTIRHVANTIDPSSGTFELIVPLINQGQRFQREGRTHLVWRFRPGQRVRVHVKVDRLDNVFILPPTALAREGPEWYVFRQNGDAFDRKAVRVVHQDARHIVVANDGSVSPGLFVVRNAAAQLNRALKTETGLPPGYHMHADGSIHANH